MPTYAYRCKKCSYEFEELQKISDEPLVHCPSCKQDSLVRIIHGGAGLVFKGSGFYLTDYKNRKKDSPKTSTPTGKEIKPSPKSDPKTDTKTSDTGSSTGKEDSPH